MVSRQEQKSCGDVVAQTVLARQRKEEFSLIEPSAAVALVDAKLSRLPENLLLCNGPANTRDRNREQQQHNHLRR
jgi:hypothetical protein